MKKPFWHKFTIVYVALLTVLTYVPILLTVIYSFNESKLSTVWDGFSPKWYRELFRDGDIWEALLNSLILAGSSCLLAIVIGTTGALGMHGRKRKADKAVAGLSLMPIMIPEIILDKLPQHVALEPQKFRVCQAPSRAPTLRSQDGIFLWPRGEISK